IGLKEIFETLILEDQASLISRAQETAFVLIPPVAATDSGYVLSSSQRRLWVISQLREGSVGYNIPSTFIWEGALDIPVLTDSFNALIARHEILRTVFKGDDQGSLMQCVCSPDAIGFKLEDRDLRKEQTPEASAKPLINNMRVSPFDFAAGPLLRTGIFQVADDRWIFAYVIHHII